MNSDNTTWRFKAIDTWFFRESRPHDSAGGSQLGSHFPPPARTLAGAIRTLIGEINGVDWEDFNSNEHNPVRPLIGHSDTFGPLSFQGPWLFHDEKQRLYPVPAFLLEKEQDGEKHYLHLDIGDPVHCDLGHVRLPALKPEHAGARPLQDQWLTAQGLRDALCGRAPAPSEVIDASQLFHSEPRLGIARDNNTRTALDSLLYQTTHIRPKPALSVEMDVTGMTDKQPEKNKKYLLRLGGEGRMAEAQVLQQNTQNPHPDIHLFRQRRLILVLLTPAYLNNPQGLPDDAATPAMSAQGDACWKLNINDVALTIHSAVLGKTQREGGWNMARHKPRPVRSLIPAGSAWYCSLDDGMEIEEAITRLLNAQIGEQGERCLGRGQLTVGLWPEPLTTENKPTRSTT